MCGSCAMAISLFLDRNPLSTNTWHCFFCQATFGLGWHKLRDHSLQWCSLGQSQLKSLDYQGLSVGDIHLTVKKMKTPVEVGFH